MHKQRKFLIYLSIFLSAFLSLPACGSGGTGDVAAVGTVATSTAPEAFRVNKSESLQGIIKARQTWQAAETKNFLDAVHSEKVAAAAKAAQKVTERARERAAESTTLRAASVATQAPTASPRGVWDTIAQCESGGNWGSRGGRYEGGLQFSPSTWTSYVAAGRPYGLEGFPAHAYDASREQQIVVAERVRDGVPGSSKPYLNAQGYGAWPTCRHRAGV